MNPYPYALFTLELVLLIGLIYGQLQNPVPNIDQKCFDCICQASTDCNTNIGCSADGANSYFCGPYHISWAYWYDSGRPGYRGGPNDFEKCLNDKACAERSVKGYMQKYGKDCDNDGSVTCFDYGLIHKLGPGNCQSIAAERSVYWDKFLACYGSLIDARKGNNDYDSDDNKQD